MPYRRAESVCGGVDARLGGAFSLPSGIVVAVRVSRDGELVPPYFLSSREEPARDEGCEDPDSEVVLGLRVRTGIREGGDW